ncbi:MAG: hypothetical protein ACT4PW_05705 [Acidimicrobiia bacterium]
MRKPRPTAETFVGKERVVAVVDMPGIPAGTGGKVAFVEGLTWTRYWVRFDNGVVRGTIDRKKLARPAEWGEIVRRREAGDDDRANAAVGPGSPAAPAALAAAGESVIVNGVAVPALLIDRTKKRLDALGVSRS